jgi:hypothetical protein
MNTILPMGINPLGWRRFLVKYAAELDCRMNAAVALLSTDKMLTLGPAEKDEIRDLLAIGGEAARHMYAEYCEQLIEVATEAS